MRVQRSDTVRCDGQVAAGELRGSGLREAGHQDGVLAKVLDSPANLARQIRRLSSAGRAEDPVLTYLRVFARCMLLDFVGL